MNASLPHAPETNRVDRWCQWLIGLLVLGNISMSRSFAHLGVAPLFIGDLSLAFLLVARPHWILGRWLNSLRQPGPLHNLAWWLYLFLIFGLLQTLRGLVGGNHAVVAVQNSVFHVYALFLFAGLGVGLHNPDLLPRLIRVVSWVHGIYGVVYIALLSPAGLTFDADNPDAVAWFGQPKGAAVCLLALVSFEPKLTRVVVPLLLNSFVLLGMQVRAEWLAFLLSLALWGLLAGRLLQMTKMAAVVAALLVFGLVTDLKIPAPELRGGELSTRHLVGRALASANPELASQFIRNVDEYTGTVSWRTEWWKEIWKATHQSEVRTILGGGYGYPIWNLHPQELGDVPIRTPHNVFIYALGYTGWVGVALFYAFQLSLAGLLWRTYRATGQPFGLCYWLLMMFWAHFDNILEAPSTAIPIYVLCGLSLAPLLELAGSAARQVPASTATFLSIHPRLTS